VPAVVGVGAWGLGSATSAWWSGPEYYNPYYAEPIATAAPAYSYDYSQPVVINDYSQQYLTDEQAAPAPTGFSPTVIAPPAFDQTVAAAAPAPPTAQAPAPTETDRGLDLFDQALAEFKAGNYETAVELSSEALQYAPHDPVIHEVRALALFALGDYKSAAATLNALLAMSPGMDWTTLSSLYGNADDYSQQLRKLESQCQSNPRDAAAHFVLAYHYLVTGNAEEAIDALRVVVAQQPRDATAKRMLEALAPPEPPTAIAAVPTPPEAGVRQAAATEPVQPKAAGAAAGPEADLVGRWRAEADGTTIELAIDAASQFEWSATPPGGTATKLAGNVFATSDRLVLESESQGSMVGNVKTIGPDEFRFALAGGPPDTKGLDFRRVR
jgi:tetratricopeptide (TPR) repeat protein